jgi:hypothetical protein
MPHKNSQVKTPHNQHTLVVGLTADSMASEEMPPGFDFEELRAEIDRVGPTIEAAGIVGEVCLVSRDPDEAEAQLRERFAKRSFGIAIVGAGIRLFPQNTVLLERVVNVLIDLQPGILLTFNTHPKDNVEAIYRWLHR